MTFHLRTLKHPAPDGVADECEAFLAGRYVELTRAMGWRVPAWAWLNDLAHGSPRVVRRLAAGRRSRGRRSRWTAIVDELAATVVPPGADDAAVADLQRDVLVPLELAVAESGEPATPADLAAVVDRELAGRHHFDNG
jgi:hypothetical protein